MIIKFDKEFLERYPHKHSLIIKFIKNNPKINAPTKEINLLFQILDVSRNSVVRDQAILTFLDIISQRNTNLAIPDVYWQKLTDPEKDKINLFVSKLNKLENRSAIAKYPLYWFETDDVKSFARAYIKNRLPNPIQKESCVVTLGSCFAVNISRHLSNLGYKAESFELGELVNNSYTNLRVLEYISGENHISDEARLLQPDMINGIDKLAKKMAGSTHVIFTLGLSMAFYSNDTNQPLRDPLYSYTAAHYKNYSLKPVSINENIDNLRLICQYIRKISPRSQFILSLSPIPLDGTKGFSYSVVEADCISKSIGRSTIAYLQAENPDLFYYFPSFELIRWVSPNLPIPLFGGDLVDAHQRHITSSILNSVLDIFVEFNCR
jgi:hypothetical protein